MSNISRNSEFTNNSVYGYLELIALVIFVCIYVLIRLTETYIMPSIPYFLTREVSALFRWGPILIPIIFGITYFSKNKSILNNTDDNILKERMMLWIK